MTEERTRVRKRSSILEKRRRTRGELAKARERLFSIMLNSTALFILSHLIVYLFSQLVTMGIAYLAGIGSNLRYFEIYYHIPNHSLLWSMENVIIITLTAPILSLLLASIFLFAVVYNSELSGYWRIFFFWMGIQFINYFFSGLISGAVTGRGIGYPLDYALWPHIPIYLIMILLSIGFMIFFGYKNSGKFLKASPSRFWIKRQYRKQYLFYSLFLPWFIGSMTFFMLKYPDRTPQHENIFLHDMILVFSMIFLLAPMAFYNKQVTFKQDRLENQHEPASSMIIPILTVLVLFLYRYFLSKHFSG
jgi:hypothetical protein